MGWFFTKAALLTFGGAYAVLPYVYQGAVETHGWLSGPQMIDGLALGETTPGPLIMVVAFVGFVGGWLQQAAGPDALFARRGARRGRRDVLHVPAVVRVHPRRRAARRGHARQARIHGAAVGDHRGGRRRDPEPRAVLRVARAVAAGIRGAVSTWASAGIALVARVALFRFKVGVMPLLAASAVLGLVATLAF